MRPRLDSSGRGAPFAVTVPVSVVVASARSSDVGPLTATPFLKTTDCSGRATSALIESNETSYLPAKTVDEYVAAPDVATGIENESPGFRMTTRPRVPGGGAVPSTVTEPLSVAVVTARSTVVSLVIATSSLRMTSCCGTSGESENLASTPIAYV